MRLWCYSPRFIVMRTFTWPIALLLAGLLFQTVAFAVLNTVVPLWMEQSDAATWEAGLVGAFFFLGNLAGTLMAGGVIRKAGFKGSYQYACVLCAASTLLLLVFPGALAWSGLRLLTGISCALVWVVVESALLRAGTLKTRGILLASYLVVYYLGTVLGQLLLGWFPSDMSLVVTEVCVLSAVGMIPLLFARLESDSAGALSSTHVEVRTLLKRRSVFLGVVGCVISGVVLGTIYCLMPLFLKHQGMNHSSVGYWMALLIAAAILLWKGTVSHRMIRHDVRRVVIAMSWLMVGWLLLRLFKYQLPQEGTLCRICWYGYYLFQLALPVALLYLTEILDRAEGEKRLVHPLWPPFAVYVFSVLLVMTNDLHQLVFCFTPGGSWASDYRYGPGYWIVMAFALLFLISALWNLLRKGHRSPSRRGRILPLLFCAGLLVYLAA